MEKENPRQLHSLLERLEQKIMSLEEEISRWRLDRKPLDVELSHESPCPEEGKKRSNELEHKMSSFEVYDGGDEETTSLLNLGDSGPLEESSDEPKLEDYSDELWESSTQEGSGKTGSDEDIVSLNGPGIYDQTSLSLEGFKEKDVGEIGKGNEGIRSNESLGGEEISQNGPGIYDRIFLNLEEFRQRDVGDVRMARRDIRNICHEIKKQVRRAKKIYVFSQEEVRNLPVEEIRLAMSQANLTEFRRFFENLITLQTKLEHLLISDEVEGGFSKDQSLEIIEHISLCSSIEKESEESLMRMKDEAKKRNVRILAIDGTESKRLDNLVKPTFSGSMETYGSLHYYEFITAIDHFAKAHMVPYEESGRLIKEACQANAKILVEMEFPLETDPDPLEIRNCLKHKFGNKMRILNQLRIIHEQVGKIDDVYKVSDNWKSNHGKTEIHLTLMKKAEVLMAEGEDIYLADYVDRVSSILPTSLNFEFDKSSVGKSEMTKFELLKKKFAEYLSFMFDQIQKGDAID